MFVVLTRQVVVLEIHAVSMGFAGSFGQHARYFSVLLATASGNKPSSLIRLFLPS
jgi:hypothetical protein